MSSEEANHQMSLRACKHESERDVYTSINNGLFPSQLNKDLKEVYVSTMVIFHPQNQERFIRVLNYCIYVKTKTKTESVDCGVETDNWRVELNTIFFFKVLLFQTIFQFSNQHSGLF